MPSIHKKSFAAEQLARQKKTNPVVWVLVGVAVVALLVCGYVIYQRSVQARVENVAQQKKSIAVLPFRDMSPKKDQEYLGDGIAETIINILTQIGDINVPAGTSSSAFKGKDLSIIEIGKQLNVETVLEGTVQKEGNYLRITAQLINVADGFHIWSKRYEREFDSIFAIQDSISLAIVEALKGELLGNEKATIEKRYTENSEAYDYYLKGRFFFSQRTEEGFYKGIELFEQAIDADPGYAKAYTGIADCYSYLSVYFFTPPTEGFPKAKEYAKNALEIDSTLSEAHISMGIIHLWYDWDFRAAEREFLKAIDLGPHNIWAHYIYSFYLTVVGRHDEAINIAKEILKQEPLSVFYNTGTCMALYRARRYDEAILQLHTMLELDPQYSTAHSYLGFVYAVMGMGDRAIEAHKKALSLTEDFIWAEAGLGYAYAISGKKEEAYDLLEKYSDTSIKRYIPPFVFIAIYTGLGEKDKAFEYLDKAFIERDSLIIFSKVDPWYDSLRSDKRFEALLRKMNYPEE